MTAKTADPGEALQSILAKAQRIDLWPPWDALRTIVDLVSKAIEIAFFPPPPDPESALDTAAGWRKAAAYWETASDDLRLTVRRTDDQVWEGRAAEAYRGSVGATAQRFDSVVEVAHACSTELETFAGAMKDARLRHQRGYEELEAVRLPSDVPSDPREAVEDLARIIEAVRQGIADLIGAYEDAGRAVEEAEVGLRRAMDGAQLPRHTVEGMSAIDQTNLPSGDGGMLQDTGPLRGDVARRAQEALDAMSPDEQAQVDELLAHAGCPEEQAWILAAVAAGTGGSALVAYADKLRSMTDGGVSPEALVVLDPTTSGVTQESGAGIYRQPDETTCGSSTLVMARMINDPAYAMYIATGFDPTGEHVDPPGLSVPMNDKNDERSYEVRLRDARFGLESVAMHDRTNTLWPEAFGTSPWDVDEQMSADQNGSGVPGADYASQIVDPADRGQTYDAIVEATSNGHAVPILAYDNAKMFAHYTLVVAAEGDTVTVYNPQYGTYAQLTREQFVAGDVDGVLGRPASLMVSLPTGEP